MARRVTVSKTDNAQAAIVKALRQIPGVVVVDFTSAGNGVPDLAVLFKGQTFWLEVKDPLKPSPLTPFQVKWHAEAKHVAKVQVFIVTNTDEAFAAIGCLAQRSKPPFILQN